MSAIIDIPRERAAVAAVPKHAFIAGEWREGSTGKTIAVEDPSTGETIAEVADSGVEDALAALTSAADRQAEWAAWAPRERGEILRRAFELLVARTEELALVMTLEMGKPLAESRGEIAYAAEFFRWFSEEAVRIDGSYSVAPNGKGRLLTMRQPVGPVLLITPWNFPLAMGTRKIGPAVAAGCTMVVKPAKQTPLSMLTLAAIMEEAGLPKGVLNVFVSSSSATTVAPLMSDPRLRKVSFTGSTEVGQTLVEQSAKRLLRVSMELGGNAPFLVFADADVDAAVDGAMLAKMRNGGEACTSANRFYVHDALHDTFVAKLTARMAGLKVGRGVDPGVEVGPLIDDAQRGIVRELVEDALGRGATTGGSDFSGERGYFYAPTVLSEVAPDSRILQEEIFGPVAPIVRFTDDDDAIAAANSTDYGLVAYAYTRDTQRAFKVIEQLDSGMVGLNQGIVSNAAAPFGGVKLSGYGREGGAEGIDEYLYTKYAGLNV